MKNKSLLLSLFLLMGLPLLSFPQNVKNPMFFKKHHLGYRIVLDNGTYHEFFLHYSKKDESYECMPVMNFSEGTYKKYKNSYRLTSFEQRRDYKTLPIHLSIFDTAYNDSLYINITSPYERMLKKERDSYICNYRHPRIYRYQINVKCGLGKINRQYERSFNARHANDSVGYVTEDLPHGVTLRFIKVLIRWDKTYALYFEIDSKLQVSFSIDARDSKSNFYSVELPSFDYHLLSYKSYKNKRLHIIDDKIAKFNGQYYVIDWY